MAPNAKDNKARAEEQFALEPPRMTILSDHPILGDEDSALPRELDSFTLISRLGTVYDIIRHKNTRAPIAIAIYGDWGTGKSSAMRWLADRLNQWSKLPASKRGQHKRVRTVWFEPWKFQTREDVWRGLVAEVILNSIDIKKASLSTVISAARNFGLFLGRSFLNVLSSAELTVGSKELGGEAKVNLDVLNKIAEDYKQTAHPEKAFLNEFEATLKHWVESALGHDERMVIFIDDLDRCLPSVTLEVLEALKLYLNIPRIIFVLGLDRDVVLSVVRDHYQKQGLGARKADQYLDKMFQVEVDIPPTQRQMEDYLPSQVESLDQAAEGYWSEKLQGWNPLYREIIEAKIRDLADHNPREVKRLLNSTLLRGSGAERDAFLPGGSPERFTQGCQVFLIQRVLRKFVPESDRLMREERTWEFFDAWSKFVQDHPDFHARPRRHGGMDTDAASRPAREKPAPSDTDSQIQREYEGLRALQPRYPDKDEPYPLLPNEHLWDLIAIPFSSAIAAAAPATRREPPPAEPGTPPAAPAPQPPVGPTPLVPAQLALATMPRGVKSAIARGLNKHVDTLSDADLLRVSELDLSGAETTDAELPHLAKLTALQKLDLGRARVSDAGLAPLANLTALRSLNLLDTCVTDAGLAHLAKVSALQELVLLGTKFTDAGLAHLANLTALRDLSLVATEVTDSGLVHLANLTLLHSLDLGGTHASDAGLAHLAKLGALQHLGLAHTQVADAGLAHLAKLTSLQSLGLALTRVTGAGLAHLANLTALHSLDLRHTQLADAGLAHLANLTALRVLNLVGTQVTDAGLAYLKKLTSLQELWLYSTQVTDAGVAKLKAALPGCTVYR